MKIEEIKSLIKKLDDAKVEKVSAFEGSKGYFFNYIIIGICTSGRHAVACAKKIASEAKQAKWVKSAAVNTASESWTTIDLGDSVVHLLTDSVEGEYKLAELMKEFGNKEIKID